MLRNSLQNGARRLLTTAASRSKKVDLVCPICFDFGFTQTAFRGSIEYDSTSDSSSSRPSSPQNEQNDKKVAKETLDKASKMTASDMSQKSASPQTDKDMIKETPDSPPKMTSSKLPQNSAAGTKMQSAMSKLSSSEIMRHRFNKNIETIYTMPIDNEIVDSRVYDILGGQKPEIKELGYEEAKAFVRAELIKNNSIPFDYWLQQPCPAHRDTKGETAPCVTFRRGLHDYMMEASSGYADRQQLMQDLGFVNTGGSAASQCLRIGHMSAGEIPTCVWSVEPFLKTEIPSPWRQPWYPDRGLTIFERPTISKNTASEEAFQKAAGWFRECNDTHSTCSLGEPSELPERVLDIFAEDTKSGVKLVQTNGQKARYACLSHRWGKDTSQATGENISSLCKEVPWDYLSPTYQDSITFLRKFSKWHQEEYGEPIRYIWIDSLCIIQDSKSDWSKHSLKMSDTYSNSIVTLVESHELGTDKRLFQDASSRDISKPVSITDAHGKDHELHFRKPIFHPTYMINDGNIPVWKRAWVFQERLLSHRLLIFGPDELSWQCASHHRCECGLDESESRTVKLMKEWGDDIHVPERSASSRRNMQQLLGDDPSHSQLRRAWRHVIEAYSQLDYTYRSDTLYAIAGLAKSFNAKLGGKNYFAGIWYEDYKEGETEDFQPQAETALDLLWRLTYLKDAEREDLPEPAVPISWSWAYPECAVTYPFAIDEVLDQFSLVVSIGGAMNVPKLPDDHDKPRDWVKDDMYAEVPPSGMIIVGPIWKTKMTPSGFAFTISNTEYPEYTYYLGAMSASILQESSVGREIVQKRILLTPPQDEDESDESALQKLPHLVFYPDSMHDAISESLYCLPIATFKRLPIKSTVKEKTIFAALVLEAVGHKANTEGYDPDLSKKDVSELVFRRVGLAYTADGGWTDEHDALLQKCPYNATYLVQ